MARLRIVMDTNVLHAGLDCSCGASHRLLHEVDSGTIRIVLSTALFFEYERVVRSRQAELGLPDADVQALLAGRDLQPAAVGHLLPLTSLPSDVRTFCLPTAHCATCVHRLRADSMSPVACVRVRSCAP